MCVCVCDVYLLLGFLRSSSFACNFCFLKVFFFFIVFILVVGRCVLWSVVTPVTLRMSRAASGISTTTRADGCAEGTRCMDRTGGRGEGKGSGGEKGGGTGREGSQGWGWGWGGRPGTPPRFRSHACHTTGLWLRQKPPSGTSRNEIQDEVTLNDRKWPEAQWSHPLLPPSTDGQNPLCAPSFSGQNPLCAPSFSGQNPLCAPSFSGQNQLCAPSFSGQNPLCAPAFTHPAATGAVLHVFLNASAIFSCLHRFIHFIFHRF